MPSSTSSTLPPVGTIVPFVSSTSGKDPIPYGWLECNGTFVLGTSYRDFYDVKKIKYDTKTKENLEYPFCMSSIYTKRGFKSPKGVTKRCKKYKH